MMGWEYGFGGGWMLFGSLLMLLFWGGLIALVVLAVRALWRPSIGQPQGSATPPHRSADGALAILKERYARGEITKDQYEQMRADLLA